MPQASTKMHMQFSSNWKHQEPCPAIDQHSNHSMLSLQELCAFLMQCLVSMIACSLSHQQCLSIEINTNRSFYRVCSEHANPSIICDIVKVSIEIKSCLQKRKIYVKTLIKSFSLFQYYNILFLLQNYLQFSMFAFATFIDAFTYFITIFALHFSVYSCMCMFFAQL